MPYFDCFSVSESIHTLANPHYSENSPVICRVCARARTSTIFMIVGVTIKIKQIFEYILFSSKYNKYPYFF